MQVQVQERSGDCRQQRVSSGGGGSPVPPARPAPGAAQTRHRAPPGAAGLHAYAPAWMPLPTLTAAPAAATTATAAASAACTEGHFRVLPPLLLRGTRGSCGRRSCCHLSCSTAVASDD